MTSHPMMDSDGTTWNIGASPLPTAKYHVIKIPSTGTAKQCKNLELKIIQNGDGLYSHTFLIVALQQAKVVATIDSHTSTALTYNHSFTMTKNYVIFMEQPLMMSIIKMAQMGIKGTAVKDSFYWDANSKVRLNNTPNKQSISLAVSWKFIVSFQQNRIHVIEKESGKVIKTQFITNEAYFVLHYVNAYEEGNQIVIDMMTYPNSKTLDGSELKKLRNGEISTKDSTSQMNRFVIPLVTDAKVSKRPSFANHFQEIVHKNGIPTNV